MCAFGSNWIDQFLLGRPRRSGRLGRARLRDNLKPNPEKINKFYMLIYNFLLIKIVAS
jgi:hypothetical protein